MSDRLVRELLAEATRDIPAEVLRPPLVQIRGRASRRRIIWPISISGGLAALVAASALTLTTTGAGPEPVQPILTHAWSHAYAADGGRSLTIYLHSPSRCETLQDPHATVSESDEAVTVTVTGEVVRVDDCSSASSPIATVRLGRPLGGRVLRDGARDADRPVFREEQVPVIPPDGGWRPVRWGQRHLEGDPPRWHASFTKPGGPDVSIDAYVKGSERPMSPAIGTIRLGSRERNLHPTGDTFRLSWDDGPVIYVLTLEPSEGEEITEAQFREVVGTFAWP